MAEILRRIIGFDLPSDSPLFLSVLSFHIVFGIACVVLGIVAMLSEKRRGKHPKFGTMYYWSLALLFVSATLLAAMRGLPSVHSWRAFLYGGVCGAHRATTVVA